MQVFGKYAGASRALNGDLLLKFAVTDDAIVLENLNKMQDAQLDIDIKKHRVKRSTAANDYFWALCDKMATVLKSDKYTIYLLQLKKYGVWVDVEVVRAAVNELANTFRYVEILEDDGGERVNVRCTLGSSQYNTEQMSKLIDGTVNDAQDMGINTWTDIQRQQALECWEVYYQARKEREKCGR